MYLLGKSYYIFLFSSLVPTREAETLPAGRQVLPGLALCFQAFVHLSGNFTPSSIPSTPLRAEEFP